MFNPLAIVMVQMHHAIISQSEPSVLGAAGADHLVVACLIVAAVFASGILMYRRVRPRLAEQI